MPYDTDQKLKNYLDSNQLHREQMCRAILEIDKRFTTVTPRHPRGGRDGGRDIEAIYRDEQLTYGAVGFINQANDSNEQKKTIKAKFTSDLRSALSAEKKPNIFVFLTNISFTIGEKERLVAEAKQSSFVDCEIFDRERLRIALDAPDGFSIRFQYLNIPLSEEEQASFFARWGDDIQSVISTGFQRMESTLDRILFLQESTDTLNRLTLSFELDRKYTADEIGHFRLFCLLHLKEAKHNIFGVLFGSSDRSSRMREDLTILLEDEETGIKHGISSGQWEEHFNTDQDTEEDEEKMRFKNMGGGSSIGMNEIEFLSISYSKGSFIRFFSELSLKDFDDAMFLPFLNRSLAEKIKAIHIYANGYKLQEIKKTDFQIDDSKINPDFPVIFSKDEILDPWIRLRPSVLASTFHIRFSEETPKRLFTPTKTEDSLEKYRVQSRKKSS